jgi:hypothetical protein
MLESRKSWNVYDGAEPASLCERPFAHWGPFTEAEAEAFILRHPHGAKLYMAAWPLDENGRGVSGGSPLRSPKRNEGKG